MSHVGYVSMLPLGFPNSAGQPFTNPATESEVPATAAKLGKSTLQPNSKTPQILTRSTEATLAQHLRLESNLTLCTELFSIQFSFLNTVTCI